MRGLAHVTGGGIAGNLARVLPDGLGAVVDPASWERPEVFGWLAANGVAEDELRRVFNIGIGYCAVIPAADVQRGDLVIGSDRRGQRGRVGVTRARPESACSSAASGTNLQALIDAGIPIAAVAANVAGAPALERAERIGDRRRPSSRSTTTPTATRATRRWPTGSRARGRVRRLRGVHAPAATGLPRPLPG